MGFLFTAIGQIEEGRIAKAQGSFEHKLALRNQQALEREAKAEKAASRLEESRVARKQKIVMAAQRAILAKSGVGLAGATTSVLADTAFQFFLDRNLVLRGGLIRARELIERGRIGVAKGKWAKTLGKEAARLSYIKAAGTILGGASSTGWFGGTTGRTTTGSTTTIARGGTTGTFTGFGDPFTPTTTRIRYR